MKSSKEASKVHNDALKILKQSINDEAKFRDNQWEAINQLVLKKSKTLVVQRTGWGKSAVYFISTRLFRNQNLGPTIIISPLIALMRNQIISASSYGVNLETIHSSQSPEDEELTIKKLLKNDLDALIIAPEQLAREEIIRNVLEPISKNAGLLVIDEAHCISEWGHDFRPDYQKVKTIIKFLPNNMPVLLTTATANNRVIDDIVDQLGGTIKTIRGPLTRKSLHLQCISYDKPSERFAWLAQTIPKLPGTGIIYASTKRDVNRVADWLSHCGIDAKAYHSGIRSDDKLYLEQALLNNEIKVLVATNALGMGYDKPDLAFVVHYQSPGSVIRYYQEVGRAGRSIAKAYGVLLSGKEDDDIQRYFINQAFPDEHLVNTILNTIEDSEDGLREFQIIGKINAKVNKVRKALKFLLNESPSPIFKGVNKKYYRNLESYDLPREKIKRRSELRLNEWKAMEEYISSKNCLMQFLSKELNDHNPHPCGRCANCSPKDAISTVYSKEMAIESGKYLQKINIPIKPKERILGYREMFPIFNFPYKLKDLMHEPGRVLCYWADPGWGELVKIGKKDKSFDKELVIASANLIKNEWKLEPFPEWLTFVPSDRSKLVEKFATELANELRIDCIEVVYKIKQNQPQKTMQNKFYQCTNLDGVFEIASNIPTGPALLIDDIYDSGWTFTVISALLRRAGSDRIYPFAVTSTTNK